MALAKNRDVAALLDFRERVNTEGYPFSVRGLIEGATFTTDGSVSVSSLLPGLTRAFAVDTVTVACSKNARVQIDFHTLGFDTDRAETITLLTVPNQTYVLPLQSIIRPPILPNATAAAGAVSARIRAVYDADKTGTTLLMSAIGWSLTDDLDFFAPKTILWIGDSITGPGTGPTVKGNQYDWRVRKFYRDKGLRARLVQMSLSGSTSPQHAVRIANGWYDSVTADLVVYSVGTNDAVQAVPTATYRANVDSAIAWKQANQPQAQMLVIGPTPQENNTFEAALVNLRTEAAAAVTAAADPRVKFCNLGSAFDRTVAGNYASSDTAGSRIHLSDAGHAAVWAVLQPFLAANLPTL